MVYLGMKRCREGEGDSITTMASCLMLLSRGAEFEPFMNSSSGRVFECKTCNRQFSSFQALGGHRASHKKPRTMEGGMNSQAQLLSLPVKPKTHECSVCGLEFAIGQALGGHMRRHRAGMNENHQTPLSLFPTQVPVVKKSKSRRVLCLDLNLTPSENDRFLFVPYSSY
ncbi:zinc finger protein ZAT12-like [Cornus florida]|uniref:zinc finger protein ZAT12-like n=1 Tax=Cornus florida TaxID=4283 RepID=UPI0028A06271|nr:zinc finger protein ZAT12-like [Cornus florida]